MSYNRRGGGSGTTNYNNLQNLPKINSVEVKGDKTAQELSLVSQSELQEVNATLNNKADISSLPVIATNNNIGLVKPDGTTVIIDETGKIVATGTDGNFIPAGTVITVEADGSGQFTKLSEAIEYLTGKWSNGVVTIQLGEGDFVEESTINIPEFNINMLQIIGQGADKTSISCSDITDYNYVIANTTANIKISNLLLKGNMNYKLRGLYANLNGSYLLEDVNLYDFERGSIFVDGTNTYLKGVLKIGATSSTKSVDTGIQSVNGAIVILQNGANLTLENCVTGFYCNGAIISSYPSSTVTYTKVTNNKTSVKNGLYLGGVS